MPVMLSPGCIPAWSVGVPCSTLCTTKGCRTAKSGVVFCRQHLLRKNLGQHHLSRVTPARR